MNKAMYIDESKLASCIAAGISGFGAAAVAAAGGFFAVCNVAAVAAN